MAGLRPEDPFQLTLCEFCLEYEDECRCEEWWAEWDD